jgi:hypothetical protein
VAVDRVDMEWTSPVVGRVAGAAVTGLGILLINAGVAIWAQASGRDFAALNAYQFEDYSLTRHLLAMLVVTAFTVGIAATLWRRTQRPLALLVILGTASGPMWVSAAPVRADLARSLDDTVLWWHAVVQAPQAVLMLAATLMLARLWPQQTVPAPPWAPVPMPAEGPSDTAWFAVVSAVALTVQVIVWSGNDSQPGPAPMIGWSLLAAGAAVLARRPSPAWGPAAVLTGSAIVVSTLQVAYHRSGGWPGTTGWETFAQSPVVLSWGTAGVMLALPTVAVLASLRRRPLMATAMTSAS